MLLFGTQRVLDNGHLEIGGCDAAELAQRLQLLPLLAAEQVVDGVEDRPGMRLHRDAVVAA